jgi:hypothetical protein
MANKNLYAVGNATGADASLTSTTGSKNAITVFRDVITHTGGSDGDYIQIPNCSEAKYYADHHILVVAKDKSWTVSLWSNDAQSGLLYWNSADAYSIYHPLAGSDLSQNGTILIQNKNGVVSVGWARWD